MNPSTPIEAPDPDDPGLRPVGVVLAGGSSRRLGGDKSQLAHPSGGTLLDFTVRRLAAVCDEVVVASRGRHPHPAAVDDGPGAGPAAGILGAASARPGRSLLVLACDLPSVPTALLEHLSCCAHRAQQRADDEAQGKADAAPHRVAWDWVVPAHPEIEPLCAIYGPRALLTLERRVANGRFSLHGLLDEPALRVLRLGVEELSRFGPVSALFRNLNTAEDVAHWRRESGEATQRALTGAPSGDDPPSAHSRRKKSKR